MSKRFEAAAFSALGGRSRNDDTWLTTDRLLLVADGVGGGPAGKDAADLAARTIRDFGDSASTEAQTNLIDATRIAHNAIVEQGKLDHERRGMACTLDASLLYDSNTIVGVHVGDSRAYHVSADVVTQLTVDEAIGRTLLRSLGGADIDISPYSWKIEASVGDRIVLATDGLWSRLDDAVVSSLIAATACLSPGISARVLVNVALGVGASDNVTVVVGEVVEDELAAAVEVTQ